jgi:hypothetical protein
VGESWGTYIEQELALCAILGLLLQEDIADGIDDQNLAVLCNNALLSALRARNDFGLDRCADATGACLLHSLDLLVLDALLLHGALLATVPWDKLFIVRGVFGLSRLSRSSNRGSVGTGDALDGSFVTPGGLARMADVSLDKLSAALMCHEKGKVVHSTAHDDQHAKENRAEAWAEAGVVVARAPPCGEAIAQEMVVSLTLGALEDVGNDGQTLVASGDLLHVRINLPLGGDSGLLAGLLALPRIVGDEDLAGFVGVQLARALAVGFGQVVLGGAGLDAEQVVKGDIGTLGGSDLVTEAEDFMVCEYMSARLQLGRALK